MIPILYEPSETAFDHNGIGVLSDCLKCAVTCERNGSYTLELEYQVKGNYAEYLLPNYVIKALANDTDRPQLFRVYAVNTTLRGTKAVKANHISYDLIGRPVRPYTAATAALALAGIETNAVIPTGFSFETDITSSTGYSITTPRSARNILGGSEGSLIDTYGGELYFDNFRVIWKSRIGEDNGVSIRYGKNLLSLDQELDSSYSCNGVFPFWYKENDGLVMPSAPSRVDWAYGFNHYSTVDMSNDFETMPTASQLSTAAAALVPTLLAPEQTIDVSFVALHQLKEYETISALEKVALGDTVQVIYKVMTDRKKLDINVKTRVVKTVFNTLTEQYNSIELGTLKTTLADYIIKG